MTPNKFKVEKCTDDNNNEVACDKATKLVLIPMNPNSYIESGVLHIPTFNSIGGQVMVWSEDDNYVLLKPSLGNRNIYGFVSIILKEDNKKDNKKGGRRHTGNKRRSKRIAAIKSRRKRSRRMRK